MSDTRILVAYYSRTGVTKAVAEEVAEDLGGAHLLPIAPSANRSGWTGNLRCMLEAVFGRAAKLLPISLSVADYDLVIVGSPLWAASVSSPARAFLREHCRGIRRVAFFVTSDTSPPDRAFRQMRELCGETPVASLAILSNDVRTGGYKERVERFARELLEAVEPGAAPHAALSSGSTRSEVIV